MLSSIRGRLTLSHLAVIVVAMGLSGFLLLSLLERYFLQATEDSLVAQARITAQALIPGAVVEGSLVDIPAPALNTIQQRESNIALQAENVAPALAEEPLESADLAHLADASLQLSAQLDTRIRVLDALGVVLVDSHQEEQGLSLGQDPLVARALREGLASRTEPAGPESGAIMHVALPVLVGERIVGVVYLSQTLDDASAVLHDLRSRWLLSTAAAVLLSAAVGFLLSGAITRPLRRLTVAATAVSRDQLDQQVPVRSRDEIGRLSQAFNHMTARLRAARKAQVDFVANVSHELRTPLTAVKGLVETLREGAVDDPEVRDRFLETVEDETDRLIRLVNDLLTLSRADSAALNLNREPLDVAELARLMVNRLAPQAESSSLTLSVTASLEVPLALADRDRVEQVLLNLLDNAIKYSRSGSRVLVSVEASPADHVQVRVQDDGIGIPPDDLALIGERFYRADKARSRTEGGSGLGLAIARALVEAHGGGLWIDSREGQGTIVSFTLPAA
jgi:signal transduction histidine kinase